jgi:hypothetical protein
MQTKYGSILAPVASGSYLFLATWKADIWRIMVQGQSGQKVCMTLSQPVAGHGSMYLSPQALRETENERIVVLGQLDKKSS